METLIRTTKRWPLNRGKNNMETLIRTTKRWPLNRGKNNMETLIRTTKRWPLFLNRGGCLIGDNNINLGL